jgi:hypothetical protein
MLSKMGWQRSGARWPRACLQLGFVIGANRRYQQAGYSVAANAITITASIPKPESGMEHDQHGWRLAGARLIAPLSRAPHFNRHACWCWWPVLISGY